jgi:hypothetical protein
MENTRRRESDTREKTRHDNRSARPEQDDGDDLLAWLMRDNVSDPFADRRFIL